MRTKKADRESLELDGDSDPFQPGLRVVLNRRRDDGPLGPGANALPYEAIVERSACDVPTLTAAVGSDGDGLLSEADVAVVTREAVRWDRLPRSPARTHRGRAPLGRTHA